MSGEKACTVLEYVDSYHKTMKEQLERWNKAVAEYNSILEGYDKLVSLLPLWKDTNAAQREIAVHGYWIMDYAEKKIELERQECMITFTPKDFLLFADWLFTRVRDEIAISIIKRGVK